MMRLGFVTAVQLGLGCLEEIYRIGGHVDLLLALQDDVVPDKSGRVFVDHFAHEHSLAVHKVRSINDDASLEAIRNANLDWLFIIGWSQVAGPEVLASTTNGCIGMHPTLLPVGRGRASIPWAIIKNLPETGVTAFKLDAGVDTGPIIEQHPIPIDAKETATTLYAKVAETHRVLMRTTFRQLEQSDVRLTEQDNASATEWPGRSPRDGLISDSMTVAEIDRLVRATTHPYPGAFVAHTSGSASTVWAGSPEAIPGAQAIEAVDGTYWATDVEDRR